MRCNEVSVMCPGSSRRPKNGVVVDQLPQVLQPSKKKVVKSESSLQPSSAVTDSVVRAHAYLGPLVRSTLISQRDCFGFMKLLTGSCSLKRELRQPTCFAENVAGH